LVSRWVVALAVAGCDCDTNGIESAALGHLLNRSSDARGIEQKATAPHWPPALFFAEHCI
jgi:hypothetical protein